MNYKYDPITCSECGETVVVTEKPDPETADEVVKFECECSVGSIGARKPESWGVQFL